MQRLWILIVLSTYCVTQCFGFTYFVTSMKTFRPGSNYLVSVSLQDTTAGIWETDVTVKIDKRSIKNVKKSIQVPANMDYVQTDFSLLMPAVVEEGTYYLETTFMKDQQTRTNTTQIVPHTKKNMIYIQTDKGIYKPGSLVQFRVFALDINLVPKIGKFDIFIKDGRGNRIEQHLMQDSDQYGVYSNEFQLDTVTPLGDWMIEAKFDGEKDSVTFTVEEYVLPRFEVTIKLPSMVLVTDTSIDVIVDAQYTYGEPVEGDMELTAHLDGRTFLTIKETQKGMKTYTINLSTEMARKPNQLSIDVDFTDTLGGEERTATEQTQIHRKEYKIDFSDTPDVIKPQLAFKVRGQLTKQDGTPPPANAEVKMAYKFQLSHPCYWCRQQDVPTKNFKDAFATVDSNGDFVVDIGIPENATNLQLQGYYKGDLLTSHSVSETFKTDTNMNIEVVIKSVMTNSVSFDVRSTFDMSKIFYEIISKGVMVSSGTESPNSANMKSLTITLNMDAAMVAKLAPKAKLIVVTMYQNEVIADSIEFNVDGIFKYDTTLTFDAERKTVGEATSLTVSTAPDAYVGLVAIDQSVLLLKEGNEITEKSVLGKLDDYYVKKQQQHGGCPFCRRRKRSFIRMPNIGGQTNSHKIITDAGLIYLTNAKIISQNMDFIFVDGAPDEVIRRKDGTTPEQSRSFFPETWIWTGKVAGPDGRAVIDATVPDTITSYVASAFALHNTKGLSVVEDNAKLEAFKSFYITPHLPYSLKFGEYLPMSCAIYNYLSTDLQVTVNLDTSRDEFFLNTTNDVVVEVKANSGAEVEFGILPTKLKYIQIKLTATAGVMAKDTVIKNLLIKPEGKTVAKTQAYFIDRVSADQNTAPFTETFTVPFPQGTVPGSRYIKVVAMGDIMGPALTGLDSLVKMPYGCGEQNMISLVPSVSVRKYLTAMGGLTKEMDDKTKKYIKHGYQRELNYQRDDKSFSAFGNSDKAGSTWLTTFVIDTYIEIHNLLPEIIDINIISGSINFILTKQNKDGSFRDDGKVIHANMQGGASKGPTLTAYIYNMLLKIPANVVTNTQRLSAVKAKARAYLLTKLQQSNIRESNYALAIMALAFQTEGDTLTVNEILNLMRPRKIVEDGGKEYYSVIAAPQSDTKSYYKSGPSDIEITGYVLMTLTQKGEITEGLGLVKWLLTMRNENGGCMSTQDTVIGLESLAQYAQKVFKPSPSTGLKVDVNLDSKATTFNIDRTNVRLYQSVSKEEPNNNDVVLHVTGTGSGLVQISWAFNVPVSDEEGTKPDVSVSVKAVTSNNYRSTKITACLKIENNKDPGMYLMQVELPSGTAADEPTQKRSRTMKKSENNGDSLALYFQDLQNGMSECVDIVARRTTVVHNMKSPMVMAMDYYQPEASSVRTTYNTNEVTGAAYQTTISFVNVATLCFSALILVLFM